MRYIGMGVVLSAMATWSSAYAEEGCSKDTDCKGERICVQKQCVEQPPRAPDATASPPAADPAVPASFQPAGPARPPPSQAPGLVNAPTGASSTVHRHLGGFFRPDLGFGYARASASSGGTDMSISGPAGTFGIAAGGAVSEDTILAFHLWDVVVSNPTVSMGNTTVNNANATLTTIAFGPEITTYSKENVYFSVTPSLSRATLSIQGSSADTNWGFGIRGALGKEWWVSDHWGLGVAGQVSFSLNQDSGTNPPTWIGWGATVAFSATYN
jgi:hypothetical protein